MYSEVLPLLCQGQQRLFDNTRKTPNALSDIYYSFKIRLCTGFFIEGNILYLFYIATKNVFIVAAA